MDPNLYLSYPTWVKYNTAYACVRSWPVKKTRSVIQRIRNTPQCDHSHFLPSEGITAGAFCVWHLLTETKSR